MKKYALVISSTLIIFQLVAQPGGSCDASSTTATEDPIVTNWILNLNHETNGFDDTVNVTEVWYNNCYVYVVTDGVPDYAELGTQVFDPTSLNRTYRLVRVPEVETDPTELAGEGQRGVFLDGSAIMSPGDGKDYNGWYSLAYEFEGHDFDSTGGHSTSGNIYHHHVNNTYYKRQPNKHSPLIGFMFDGFPVYGPYGFADSLDAASPVVRIETSYEVIPQLVSDGTRKNMDPDAPEVRSTPLLNGTAGPLGSYEEDYQYTAGLGHLDSHNGRWCVTPEYPMGTYAYFATIDDEGDPQYPYFMARTPYGVIQTNMAQYTASIPGSASRYTPTVTATKTRTEIDGLEIYPTINPQVLRILAPGIAGMVVISDQQGSELKRTTIDGEVQMDVSALTSGTYLVYVLSHDGNYAAADTFIKL